MTGAPAAPDRDDPWAAAVVARLRAAGCVYAEEEAALLLAQAADPDELAALVARRERGLPLELVLGWAELAGVRVVVEPGVFVPRRRTGLMVTEAVALGTAALPGPVTLLDLCCGTGAVAVAVAAGLARAGRTTRVVAADVDPAAVRCAGRNLPPPALVLRSDLYAGLPAALRGRVQVLTANVPYVPTAAIALLPREAREHEAAVALDGGPDGLAVLRRAAAGAPAWLAPGGALLVETGEAQRAAAAEALREAGLRPRVVVDDDLEATLLVGTAG